MTTAAAIYDSAADSKWGYQFGVDGLMSVEDAKAWLRVSGKTLDRLTVNGSIRKGKHSSGVRCFCKRSVMEYAKSLEA